MANLYDRLKRFQQTNTTGAVPPGTPETPKTPEAPPPSKAEALLRIPGVVRGRDLLHSLKKRDEDKQTFLRGIGVEEQTNSEGIFGLKEWFYPIHTLPFPSDDISGPEAVRLSQDTRFSSLGGTDILFVDTETTGLAGGTGTVPFLVGVGFFTESGLTVRQYFMRDYDDEPAVLSEILSLLERFPAVSSFNGKAFDIPLLQSRCLLNRRRVNLSDHPHLDLLYSSRRFWRHLLQDCRLSTIEASLFGHTREDDLPGEQIPYVYFDYLRGIRMARMASVFAHNAEDIRTLALLAGKACRMMKDPLSECSHALELWGMSRFASAELDWQKAAFFLQEALRRSDLPAEHRCPVQKQLSLLYKRCEQFAEALFVWQAMIEEYDDCFAYIEAAKCLEHREKNLAEALRLTERALEKIRNGQYLAEEISSPRELLQALLHRRGRLLRKLAGGR